MSSSICALSCNFVISVITVVIEGIFLYYIETTTGNSTEDLTFFIAELCHLSIEAIMLLMCIALCCNCCEEKCLLYSLMIFVVIGIIIDIAMCVTSAYFYYTQPNKNKTYFWGSNVDGIIQIIKLSYYGCSLMCARIEDNKIGM